MLIEDIRATVTEESRIGALTEAVDSFEKNNKRTTTLRVLVLLYSKCEVSLILFIYEFPAQTSATR
jgi:hypothetical protein